MVLLAFNCISHYITHTNFIQWHFSIDIWSIL
jgi:hypothetical protein